MLTYEELMTMAEAALLSWPKQDSQWGASKALYAQACIMLAKEKREALNAPTFNQVEELITNLSDIRL